MRGEIKPAKRMSNVNQSVGGTFCLIGNALRDREKPLPAVESVRKVGMLSWVVGWGRKPCYTQTHSVIKCLMVSAFVGPQRQRER